MRATGDIGAPGNRLAVFTGRLTSTSRNLYLVSNSPELVVDNVTANGAADIIANGAITGGVIRSGRLNIDAYGNVGTDNDNPLRINVPNANVDIISRHGLVNYRNSWRPSGTGWPGGGGAVIEDERVPLAGYHELCPPGTCEACDFIRYLVERGMARIITQVLLTENEEGGFTVTIQVGEEYEGKTLTLIMYRDGKLKFVDLVVTDGVIEFETDMPDGYVLMDGQYRVIVNTGLPFTDVNPGDWFYNAVAYAYYLDIIKGIAADMFAPNLTMTRAMFATLLHRIAGEPAVGDDAHIVPFTDVADPDSWYYDAVMWAASVGIVKGYGDGTFGAHDDVTREQMVTMMHRFADYQGHDVSARADLSGYTDAGKISDWAIEAFEWSVAIGLIRGVSATQLDPEGNATRAQAATIIQRFQERYGAKILVVSETILADW